MLDWVPCQNYEVGTIVPAVSQFDLPLMNLESWSADVEIIGDIEGEDQGYRILRIVGYWTVNYNPADNPPEEGSVYVRLWPGFQNQQDQVVEVPGLLSVELPAASAADAGRAANEKWWWERVRSWSDIDDFADRWFCTAGGRHPFTYFCDVKPNYWCSKSEVPVVSIANATDTDLVFWHRFRMLVAKRG